MKTPSLHEVALAESQMRAADKAHREGRPDLAEQIYLGILASWPGYVPARFVVGLIAGQRGELGQAIESMRLALSVEPKFFPALSALSSLLLESGQPTEAITVAEQAVALNPKDAGALNCLARSLYAGGRLSEALGVLKQASARNPNEASLHYGIASILAEQERDAEAAIEMRQAVLLAPSEESLTSLAVLELKLGRKAEALTFARRALKRAPDSVGAHTVMAQALLENGLADEADAHWKRALQLSDDPVPIYTRRAWALIGMGEFESAMADLRKSIELQPLQGFPYFAITASRRISEEDSAFVEAMQGVANDPQLPKSDRKEIEYALGKAHDNLGEFGLAMAHYDHANSLALELRPGGAGFDREEFRLQTDARMKAFSNEFFKRPPAQSNASTKPIFVIGMMRCGTTLAEQILSCHPNVGGAGEQAYWVLGEDALMDWQRGTVSSAQVASMTREYLELLESAAPGFSRVVDKNPANVLVAGLIHWAFPNSKIIHMRRRPVDTALSIWMTPMSTSARFVNDRENIVFAYRETLRLADHWRAVIPEARYLEVEYERLVADPEPETRRMLEFCDLPWDDACLHPESNVRPVKTPSFWQVRQPIYHSSLDRWKRYEPWLGAFRDLL